MNPNTFQLHELIANHSKIVFFGGAGTSTASGIPDFRSTSGLFSSQFHGQSPEIILSSSYFYAETQSFYDYLRGHLFFPNATPNDCHYGLAQLENEGRLKAVITQNIDGLHQKAGSQRVIELHGNINTLTCIRCNNKELMANHVLQDNVPLCKRCGSLLKPDVTLYEEMLDETVVEGAIEAISSSDLLIVGGTSLSVYPAAGFIRYFKGNHLVLMNYTVTPYDQDASLIIREPIQEVFKELFFTESK